MKKKAIKVFRMMVWDIHSGYDRGIFRSITDVIEVLLSKLKPNENRSVKKVTITDTFIVLSRSLKER